MHLRLGLRSEPRWGSLGPYSISPDHLAGVHPLFLTLPRFLAAGLEFRLFEL